jgi:TRAP-type C4-dicarboxylate transport system permease small subunit
MALKLEAESAERLKKLGVKVVEGRRQVRLHEGGGADPGPARQGARAARGQDLELVRNVKVSGVIAAGRRAGDAAACLAMPGRGRFELSVAGHCAPIAPEMEGARSARSGADGPVRLSIAGFTLSVFCDVVTREIGRPWLGCNSTPPASFAWGEFIGMAVATRRLDHLNLVEITKGMSGPSRSFMEIFNRLVILVVGIAMLVFGIQNFLNDLGSYRAPSLIPLATYTASVPLSGALITLFCIEQIINGWLHGFEGPEDKDDFAGIR